MTTATKERTDKVTMPVVTLLKALQEVTRVTSGRHTKPILGNVRIGDGIVSGTNLEVKIDREIGEMCEPMLLPADRLLAILRSVHATENVTLARKGTSVTVKAGRGMWTLPTEDVAEYPTWEPSGLQPVCRLPADQFCRAVKAVAYAADTESSRYALGSVLLDITGGNPTFVATDGRRLSAVEAETDQSVDERNADADHPPVLIPAHAIRIAASMAEGSEGAVQIEATAREVVFSCDGGTITAMLVDGRFPRWRDVFPDGGCEPAVIDRNELLAATRAAAVVTSEQSLGVDYAFGGDALTLSARSSEYGESKVKCAVETSGGCTGVKLNPTYVRDYLTGLPSDEEPNVSVVTHGDGGACVFTCGYYRGVVMPLAKE